MRLQCTSKLGWMRIVRLGGDTHHTNCTDPGAHNPCDQPLPSVDEYVPYPPRFFKVGIPANNGLVLLASHPSCWRGREKELACAVPRH
jgi:hypothetical protein